METDNQEELNSSKSNQNQVFSKILLSSKNSGSIEDAINDSDFLVPTPVVNSKSKRLWPIWFAIVVFVLAVAGFSIGVIVK